MEFDTDPTEGILMRIAIQVLHTDDISRRIQ